MRKITEDHLGLLDNSIGEPRRLETVTITKDEYYELRMDLYTADLLTSSWEILAKKLMKALPANKCKTLLLEAVASYYQEHADYEAENMAHWMQEEFDFRMHEVDALRKAESEDFDCPF